MIFLKLFFSFHTEKSPSTLFLHPRETQRNNTKLFCISYNNLYVCTSNVAKSHFAQWIHNLMWMFFWGLLDEFWTSCYFLFLIHLMLYFVKYEKHSKVSKPKGNINDSCRNIISFKLRAKD